MDRPTRHAGKPRSPIGRAVSAFFLAENRLGVAWRLVFIVLGACVFALIGDLLDVASRLALPLLR